MAALGARLVAAALTLLLMVPAAWAVSAADFPAQLPSRHVLDLADVLSRSSLSEVEGMLEALAREKVDARVATLNRLDYGLSLDQLGPQLLERWTPDATETSTSEPLLLLLLDTKTKSTAVVVSPALERQLPAELLRSTATTTMARPLRQGDRYRQALVDGLTRLSTVLQGGEDPGEPLVEEAPLVARSVPSQAETADSHALTWVIVLLVVGSVVPMLTWWVFSR